MTAKWAKMVGIERVVIKDLRQNKATEKTLAFAFAGNNILQANRLALYLARRKNLTLSDPGQNQRSARSFLL